ncbi:MAG: hypothetical protein Q9162_007914 [Coniocarpon cinnabarinum]
MAEALAALGLASNIVQFIDFGLKTTSTIKEIYSSASGLTSETTTLNDIATEFEKTVSSLQKSAYDNSPRLFREDIELKKLATKTILSARKIEDIIDPLRKQSARPRLRDALQNYKAVLDTRLLVDIRRRLVSANFEQSQQLEDLDDISRSLYDTLRASRDENEGYFVQIMQAIRSLHLQSIPTEPEYDVGLNLGNAPRLGGNSFFGRQDEIEWLKQKLIPPTSSSEQRIAIVSGLGGMGKTQLAVAFAQAVRTSFLAIFWLNATSKVVLQQGILDITSRMSLIPQSQEISVSAKAEKEAVARFREWLSRPQNMQWMLIFDNYNEPNAYDIREFFPYRAHGSMLITTRSTRLMFGEVLTLIKLDEEQGLSILAQRSKRAEAFEDPTAQNLAKRLDGLPLALATAGDYLRHVPDSFKEYLVNYERSWQELEESADELPDYEGRTLYSTWNLSLSLIEAHAPEALALLRFMAYFSNEDARFELFQYATDEDQRPLLSKALSSKFKFGQAMRKLQEYSLVESYHSAGSYRLHACVHDWTLDYLNCRINVQFVQAALHCVTASFVWEDSPTSWSQNRQLWQHARRLYHFRIQGMLKGPGSLSSLDDLLTLGELFRRQDWLKEAEAIYQWTMAGYEKALGPDHTSTLQTVNNLGLLYSDQDKLAEAEEMYQRALAGKERALGLDHTSTLDTVNNLGNLYSDQGKLAEAEEMYQRALAGKERALGLDHTSTLDTVNNLGVLHWNQGKLAEAEEMYQRALAGYEKALGPDHTSTLQTVNNLGILYRDQGKLAEAEEMYQRALAGYDKALDPEAIRTFIPALNTTRNLASLLEKTNRFKEAKRMYAEILPNIRKVFGNSSQRYQAAAQDLERVHSRE